jgi:hypothetical protein
VTAERPRAEELLNEARRHLLETLLPLLPADRRYDGLMVANAMAIAARETNLRQDLLRQEVRGLTMLLGLPDAPGERSMEGHDRLRELEARLAHDIREGVYDDPGPRRDAVRAYLRTSTEGQVRVSNPKALGGSRTAE